MSVWEYQQARSAARREGMKSVNEPQILQALTDLRSRVEESKEKSKKARRMSQRRREHEKNISPGNLAGAMPPSSQVKQVPPSFSELLDDDVEAFNDIA